MNRVVLLVLVLGGLAAGYTAATAEATAPGTNGPIAFRRYLDAGRTWGAIFTIGVDGTTERQVTHPPKGAVDAPPRWAPNGSLIVFSRCTKSAGCVLYSVSPTGARLRRLSAPHRPGCARCEDVTGAGFLPDGRHIAFSSFTGQGAGSSIVVADLRLRRRRVVVAGTTHASYGDPEVSPDGKRLVFTQTREPGEKLLGVYVARSDGTGARRITPVSLDAGDFPDWSPDGKRLVFRSHVDDGKQSQIWLARADGTGLTQLTHFKRGTTVTSSRFSPDGTAIVFGATGVGGAADLYVMRADGTEVKPLTRTKLWDSAPGWGPGR